MRPRPRAGASGLRGPARPELLLPASALSWKRLGAPPRAPPGCRAPAWNNREVSVAQILPEAPRAPRGSPGAAAVPVVSCLRPLPSQRCAGTCPVSTHPVLTCCVCPKGKGEFTFCIPGCFVWGRSLHFPEFGFKDRKVSQRGWPAALPRRVSQPAVKSKLGGRELLLVLVARGWTSP